MSKFDKRLYVSTASLKEKDDLEKVLSQYCDIGLNYVEISGSHLYQPLDELESLISRFQSKGMNFIFHNYFPAPKDPFVLNCASSNKEISLRSKNLVTNAVNLANKLKVDLYSFHPGYLADPEIGSDGMFQFPDNGALDKKACLDIFLKDFMGFYNELNLRCNSHRIYVGIENLFPTSKDENFSLFCSKEDVFDIFEDEIVKNSDLGILLDLGHLAISSSMLGFDRYEFIDDVIEIYGDRIYEVHFSENDGKTDQHAIIEEDSWQMKLLKKFLNTGSRCINGYTKFCLESRGLNKEEVLENYKRVKKHMEELL